MTQPQKNLDDHKFDKLIAQREQAFNECVNLYAANQQLTAIAQATNDENEALKAEIESLKAEIASLNQQPGVEPVIEAEVIQG